MKLWFYSDPHFGHENIWRKFKKTCPGCAISPVAGEVCVKLSIDDGMGTFVMCQGCGGTGEIPMRPFTSTNQMDETIIEAINARVAPSDHLWWLGDIAMKKPYIALLKRIECNHQRLIWGNHDIFPYEAYVEAGIKKFASCRVIDNILFSHYPVHPGSLGKYRANVHGHTHTNGSPEPKVSGNGRVQPYINISCEETDYAPVDMEWINERIRQAVEQRNNA